MYFEVFGGSSKSVLKEQQGLGSILAIEYFGVMEWLKQELKVSGSDLREIWQQEKALEESNQIFELIVEGVEIANFKVCSFIAAIG